MRTESEMLDLVLQTAREDERIRAVILNGSRANPNAERDIFQDFDVVYLVTDVASVKADPGWIKRLGEIMVMQLPDDMQDPPPANQESYAYLLQFMDGNRLDLTLQPISRVNEAIADSLTVALLDKDNMIPPLASPSERGYLPRPPTAKQFADCCNEFWWCSPYVGKGLWRGQVTYAKSMLDRYLREQLMKMIDWYVGVQTGFSKNPGFLGKYLQDCLPPDLWRMLMATYSDSAPDHTWEALYAMGELFRRVALPVAEHFGFNYPRGDDERVTAHLKHVRSLPRQAKAMY
ncbi:MAG TPA: aminoglycoside 6-adenylyltransferase [Anaerolineales bacterium]